MPGYRHTDPTEVRQEAKYEELARQREEARAAILKGQKAGAQSNLQGARRPPISH
jgi:hypothetical protein